MSEPDTLTFYVGKPLWQWLKRRDEQGLTTNFSYSIMRPQLITPLPTRMPMSAHRHKISHRRRAVARKRDLNAIDDQFNELHQDPQYWERIKTQHTLAGGREE